MEGSRPNPEPTPETWLDLELLATRIYAELAPACTVRHNVLLDGKLSEAQRQIDVLIEDEELGSRVIVDCKDRARRVNITDASAFAGLMEDVQATAGVLLCNRGFSKSTRTYAKKKGFSLARLHDVNSRKWRLDVLMPVVWIQLRLADLGLSMRVHLEAGDELHTDSPPRFLREGKDVDIKAFFEQSWNEGTLHTGKPGKGRLATRLDLQLQNGTVRPNADVEISYEAAGAAFLGYVTPQQARGIFDEETGGFMTATFDVGQTLGQKPEGGWIEVFDPNELVVDLAGTVVTLEETAGVEVEFTGINTLQGIEPHNQAIRWSRHAERT